MAKVLVLYYSMYGHVFEMAKSVYEGAKSGGAQVHLKRVPETLSDKALNNLGAMQDNQKDILVAEPKELADYDAIIFGTPTRFGNMIAQMRAFLDHTGSLWMNHSLINKIGSVFTSTATQHGGQETTLVSFHYTLLHHGMLIAGLPYNVAEQMTLDEISGGSPYGATTISAGDGSRMPSKNELKMANKQGSRVAELAKKME